jgi:hypothetical protein
MSEERLSLRSIVAKRVSIKDVVNIKERCTIIPVCVRVV